MINKVIDTRGIIYSHPDFEKADRTALLGIQILVGSTVLTVVTSPILFGVLCGLLGPVNLFSLPLLLHWV